MPRLAVTLVRREPIASATWAFTFGLAGKAFPYRAGQTIDLTLPHPPHQDDAGNGRTFSLASAPGRDELLIATRVRGSAFKRSLVEVPLGTALELEGPFGSFTLPQRATSVVLLAGGIGVTPFRAMVEDVIERRLEHPLMLIHSNRTPEETPFLAQLQQWSHSHPGFAYRPTMTRPAGSETAWTGETRRVGPELLADLLPADRNEPLYYYVAGPDRFVKGANAALASVGVDEDRIRFEEFPGY